MATGVRYAVIATVLLLPLQAPVFIQQATLNEAPRPLSFADTEVKVGDRLFFETRFAQYFFARNARKINGDLDALVSLHATACQARRRRDGRTMEK